jgi:hypothetical protein
MQSRRLAEPVQLPERDRVAALAIDERLAKKGSGELKFH